MNSKVTDKKKVVAEAEEKFAAHECEDYPIKPK
jgi:hypothetical protein